MIGCLRTRVREQPIIVFYFEFENKLKSYNLMARSFSIKTKVIVNTLQPCNIQLSKSIVHVLKFGDIAVIYYIVTCILVLIGGVRCLKEAKPMDKILV